LDFEEGEQVGSPHGAITGGRNLGSVVGKTVLDVVGDIGGIPAENVGGGWVSEIGSLAGVGNVAGVAELGVDLVLKILADCGQVDDKRDGMLSKDVWVPNTGPLQNCRGDQ
jgi:hypothetical protein